VPARSLRWLAPFAVAALVIAACGADDEGATTTSATVATTTTGATTTVATTTTEATTTTTTMATTTTAVDDDGGFSADEKEAAAEALAASMADLGDIEMLSYLAGNRADLDCWAEELVDSLGIEGTAAITAATTELDFVEAFTELESENQHAAADGLAACLDRDGLRDDIIEFESPEVADCVIDFVLQPDTYRTVFVAFVTGDEDVASEFETALEDSCGFG
jgi:hypothetical protein